MNNDVKETKESDILEHEWMLLAKDLLAREKRKRHYNFPHPIGVFVKWKKNIYLGSIQIIHDDIVILSKTSEPIPIQLYYAIKKLDNRIELEAEDSFNLNGRQHTLRKLDKKLTFLTDEQKKYMADNPVTIFEV